MTQPNPQGQPPQPPYGNVPQGQPPLHAMPAGHPYRPPQGQAPPPAQPPQPQQGQQQGRSVREYFRTEGRPVDAGAYAVLPIRLMEQMPPQWQNGMTALLDQLQQQFARAPWPERYRVEATEFRPVAECDEQQLKAVGIEADYDDDDPEGEELIYRDSNGERISDPTSRRIMVPIQDPL